ncbi:MAG: hypothetical protein K2L13_00250, partial [Opitutales bacterium]|nr:hypothetical protein [Opitutales bacterium]
LNADMQQNYINFTKNKSWFNDATASTYLESGLPNVVDQADVLQMISNFITTRGDTFKITAYGEHRTGDKVIQKKCEAIVQRFPEFVNIRENAPHDKQLSTTNQAFGRRFKIILFRWCN